MDVSKLWDKPDRDPVLVRDDQGMIFCIFCLCYILFVAVMFALDFIKSDDTSDVVFGDAEATTGEDVVVRGTEHRFEGSGYVNVPNVKGFTKVVASKVSTRRSSCCLIKTTDQPSASEPVELSNDIEASDDLEVGVGEIKKGQGTALGGLAGKKVVSLKGSGKGGEGSTNVNPGEVYVPDWKVTVGDSFKPSSVCEDVLTHFDSPVVRGSCSSMDDDLMISKNGNGCL